MQGEIIFIYDAIKTGTGLEFIFFSVINSINGCMWMNMHATISNEFLDRFWT